jgi:hypothetical protein
MVRIILENKVVIVSESPRIVVEDDAGQEVVRSDEYDGNIVTVIKAALRAEEVRSEIAKIAEALAQIATWDSVDGHAACFIMDEVRKLEAL